MPQPLIDKTGKTAAGMGFGEPADVTFGLVFLTGDAASAFNGNRSHAGSSM